MCYWIVLVGWELQLIHSAFPWPFIALRWRLLAPCPLARSLLPVPDDEPEECRISDPLLLPAGMLVGRSAA